MIFSVNFIEIIFLLKTRRRWNNAHILVFNLAIEDAALELISVISFSIILSQEHKMVLIAFTLSYGNIWTSSFIVILILIGRWVAVKWPLRYRSLMTKTRLYIRIFISWTVGMLTTFGVFALIKITKSYVWIHIMLIVIIPEILILIYLYCSIFLTYRKGTGMIRNEKRITGIFKSRNVQQRMARGKSKTL